jgi:hypothetical protein
VLLAEGVWRVGLGGGGDRRLGRGLGWLCQVRYRHTEYGHEPQEAVSMTINKTPLDLFSLRVEEPFERRQFGLDRRLGVLLGVLRRSIGVRSKRCYLRFGPLELSSLQQCGMVVF